MSVHADRGGWQVRWREPGGTARSRRFSEEEDARRFDRALRAQEGPRAVLAERGSSESIYPYETKAGTRYLFKYRRSDGSSDTKRGFASRSAARKARRQLVGAIERGEVRVCREDFATYFDAWLHGRRPFLSPGTLSDYRNHGEKRLKPAFGRVRPAELTTADVREWMSEQDEAVEAGLIAPKTVNNALGVLVACLNQAAEDGLIAVNPAARVQRLPLEPAERDWLRLLEIPLYLESCSSIYRPLAATLIGTGMRISEALSLHWHQVEFDRGVIRVYRSRRGRGEGPTKGRRFRSVDAGPGLLQTLGDLRARQAEQLVRDARDAYVFVMPVRRRRRDSGRWDSRPAGEPMDRTTVSRSWHKAALEDAGLRDMTLHALRHTAAASWLMTGKPLIYVQRQLGHASITTTESFYGHLEESFLRDAAASTEAAIRDAHRHLDPAP